MNRRNYPKPEPLPEGVGEPRVIHAAVSQRKAKAEEAKRIRREVRAAAKSQARKGDRLRPAKTFFTNHEKREASNG